MVFVVDYYRNEWGLMVRVTSGAAELCCRMTGEAIEFRLQRTNVVNTPDIKRFFFSVRMFHFLGTLGSHQYQRHCHWAPADIHFMQVVHFYVVAITSGYKYHIIRSKIAEFRWLQYLQLSFSTMVQESGSFVAARYSQHSMYRVFETAV